MTREIHKPYQELTVTLLSLLLFILLTSPEVFRFFIRNIGDDFIGRCIIGVIFAGIIYIFLFLIYDPRNAPQPFPEEKENEIVHNENHPPE